jgi:hypothetical protein
MCTFIAAESACSVGHVGLALIGIRCLVTDIMFVSSHMKAKSISALGYEMRVFFAMLEFW